MKEKTLTILLVVVVLFATVSPTVFFILKGGGTNHPTPVQEQPAKVEIKPLDLSDTTAPWIIYLHFKHIESLMEK